MGTGRPYRVRPSPFRHHHQIPTQIFSVSLEVLTVLGAGPMAFYILKKMAQDDPARHYWIIVICTAELYGGSASLSSRN